MVQNQIIKILVCSLSYWKTFIIHQKNNLSLMRKNDQNSLNALGKTASYNPETREVNLYFVGRHPKDLMRSFSHELVHHAQNCRGEFNNISNTNEGYAQADAHLREMEREAYECGNMIFRDWEDEMKSKGAVPLFSGAPFATIQMGYNENLGDKKMSKKLNESQLRDIIRGVIQEMFDEDINEENTMDKMMDDNAAESVGADIEAAGDEVAVSLEEEVEENMKTQDNKHTLNLLKNGVNRGTI
jgi:hypothetical protein